MSDDIKKPTKVGFTKMMRAFQQVREALSPHIPSNITNKYFENGVSQKDLKKLTSLYYKNLRQLVKNNKKLKKDSLTSYFALSFNNVFLQLQVAALDQTLKTLKKPEESLYIFDNPFKVFEKYKDATIEPFSKDLPRLRVGLDDLLSAIPTRLERTEIELAQLNLHKKTHK